ncbi:hypothetical protein BG32_12045 [Mesotoga sp. HF07.pep.5.2.highcov]|jgi:hypothetical protein|nr:hypothetical protein BG32_12045 [Mesotoga sp. HF07.pep.5.2.highcov]
MGPFFADERPGQSDVGFGRENSYLQSVSGDPSLSLANRSAAPFMIPSSTGDVEHLQLPITHSLCHLIYSRIWSCKTVVGGS